MTERGGDDPPREMRLEGPGLLLLGGLLLVVVAASFWAGRWYERQQHGETAGLTSVQDPLAHVVAPAGGGGTTDVDDTSGHFDELRGEEQQLEPARELPTPSGPASSGSARPASSTPRSASDRGFFVQVMALRDETAAAEIVRSLEAEGFPVRLFTENEGSGSLYRVRVGGYDTRGKADEAAARLKAGDFPGAFVKELP